MRTVRAARAREGVQAIPSRSRTAAAAAPLLQPPPPSPPPPSPLTPSPLPPLPSAPSPSSPSPPRSRQLRRPLHCHFAATAFSTATLAPAALTAALSTTAVSAATLAATLSTATFRQLAESTPANGASKGYKTPPGAAAIDVVQPRAAGENGVLQAAAPQHQTAGVSYMPCGSLCCEPHADEA